MNKFYTGVGSRNTPPYILRTMSDIAKSLEELGYTLRSGGADGADYAFSRGCERKEIYLPWENFNGNDSSDERCITNPTKEAFVIAAKLHPNWSACRNGVKKLHARNVHQVLGKDLTTKSDFLVCWTLDGKEVGGTATAIKLAKENDVVVFNLGKDGDLSKLRDYIIKGCENE